MMTNTANSLKRSVPQWVLLLLLAFMASSIVISLIVIYYSAFDFEVDKKSFEYTKITPKVENQKTNWVNIFYKNRVDSNKLPASEVVIQLQKIDGYQKSRDNYSFELTDVDEYKFFCVIQVIESYNRPYSYYLRDNNLKISIMVESKEQIVDIKKSLKTYDINI